MQIRRYNIIPGMQYGTPKEVWGFRTRPRRGAPQVLAENFIWNNADLLGTEDVPLRRARQIESLGAYVQVLDVFAPCRPDILARLAELAPA